MKIGGKNLNKTQYNGQYNGEATAIVQAICAVYLLRSLESSKRSFNSTGKQPFYQIIKRKNCDEFRAVFQRQFESATVSVYRTHTHTHTYGT